MKFSLSRMYLFAISSFGTSSPVTESPIKSGGQETYSFLTWKRAAPNA